MSDFEHLCSLFAIAGMTQDTLKWKLFPFSLIGKAEQWYTYTVGSVHDNWDELRDKFCLEFFPMSRIIFNLLPAIFTPATHGEAILS